LVFIADGNSGNQTQGNLVISENKRGLPPNDGRHIDAPMQADPLRQILYHSWAVGRPDLDAILTASKRNNGIDGITGILLCDGRSYLQVLEGPQDSVIATYARICTDPRHRDITVLSDELIEQRDFAYWSMEVREPGQPSDDATFRLQRRLERLAPDLRRHFFD
jgi:hypothetical protein